MHYPKPILAPASLYTQIQVQLSPHGRPAQRRGFVARPLPRLALRPASRAGSTSAAWPMDPFQRAAGYELQRTHDAARAELRAAAVEHALLNFLDPWPELRFQYGFTPKQVRRLIQKDRANKIRGYRPGETIMDEVRNGAE